MILQGAMDHLILKYAPTGSNGHLNMILQRAMDQQTLKYDPTDSIGSTDMEI